MIDLREKIAQHLYESGASEDFFTGYTNGSVLDPERRLADAIIAALPDMIEPLVWCKSHFSKWDGDYHTVPTAYIVRCADENGYKWMRSGGSAYGWAGSPEAAKAAAEAHHRATILAALGVNTQPRRHQCR